MIAPRVGPLTENNISEISIIPESPGFPTLCTSISRYFTCRRKCWDLLDHDLGAILVAKVISGTHDLHVVLASRFQEMINRSLYLWPQLADNDGADWDLYCLFHQVDTTWEVDRRANITS